MAPSQRARRRRLRRAVDRPDGHGVDGFCQWRPSGERCCSCPRRKRLCALAVRGLGHRGCSRHRAGGESAHSAVAWAAARSASVAAVAGPGAQRRVHAGAESDCRGGDSCGRLGACCSVQWAGLAAAPARGCGRCVCCRAIGSASRLAARGRARVRGDMSLGLDAGHGRGVVVSRHRASSPSCRRPGPGRARGRAGGGRG
mmetsp:Transcript_40651/g.117574  ORF Transcript_40651/g.117574 Transcript_40651/m.117574 type:complete len:200 (-) Transcript_40651:582-1181(-)